MAFVNELYCETYFCQKPDARRLANVFPLTTNTLQFDNNIAHSSLVGMTWDGAPVGELTGNPNNPNDRKVDAVHYSPRQPATFRNLSIYKSSEAGVYFRGSTAYFDNSIFADNKLSLFFAYNQVVTNSLVVAKSDNHVTSDYNVNSEFTGIRLYDGPFDLRNVDFANFFATPIYHNGIEIRPTPFVLIGGALRFTNVVQGLRFFPEPSRRFLLSSPLERIWADWNSSPSLRDLDGSLTGLANSVLVPDHPFNADPSCVSMPGTGALRCGDYRPGLIAMLSIRDDKAWENVPFIVRRSDGAQTYANFDIFNTLPYNNKFGVIVGKSYEYEVNFRPDWIMPGKNSGGQWWPNSFQIIFLAEKKGVVSPVVNYKGLGQNCSIFSDATHNPWTRVTSLASLRAKTVNSYYSEGSNLYVKFVTHRGVDATQVGSGYATPAESQKAMVQCP